MPESAVLPAAEAQSPPAREESWLPEPLARTIVAELNNMFKGRDFQKYNGVGAIVVNRALDGKFDGWRSRGKKHPAIKKIANHPDLRIERAELYRAIGTYELWVRFDHLEKWPLVTATHVRSLLGMLPDEQRQWLDKIQAEDLTTRELDLAIAASRTPSQSEEITGALVEVRTAFRQLEEIVDDKDGLVADLVRAGVFNAEGDPELLALEVALSRLEEPLAQARARLTAHTAPKRKK